MLANDYSICVIKTLRTKLWFSSILVQLNSLTGSLYLHDLAHKMLASMAMRLHQLMNDVESYSLQSSKQHVIGYMMRELPENSQNSNNIVLTLSSNKGVIASRLNLTQEHFSRTLNELTTLGLIQVDGKKIHIAGSATFFL